MITTRLALALFALFATLLATLAAPISETPDSAEHQLERRIDHLGDATYFNPGLGACGWMDNDNSRIVAISHLRYDYPVRAKNCGQWMEIINTKNGRRTHAKVVDRCEGCAKGDVDVSPMVFRELADLSEGRIDVKWHFEAMDWKYSG